ncbi:endonuclease/exonuclease/phosphatase family protein [Arthrobacter sp. UM1]|uniref:endonuclease/exonuclease/phosphatase family protein n=1 Tax=Arthrobacter sp. UM1 TaxID=2766776 RepID=UPI001CF6CDBF|nr:endonuclease/exonuclease/phosphatase family protein [Arthrobacter sp. UM1]MCB4208836.1 endonuclease/exonuclease/phosphatase family protein [Arthrobacter sp. UM1]
MTRARQPRRGRRSAAAAVLATVLALTGPPGAQAAEVQPRHGPAEALPVGGHEIRTAVSAHTPTGEKTRVAVFEVDLTADKPGQAAEQIKDPSSPLGRKARSAAGVIEASKADVVVITGIDVGDRGAREAFEALLPASLSHTFEGALAASAGRHGGSGSSTDSGSGAEARAFPGQRGMMVASRLPIDERRVRTFANFRWKDLPSPHLPDDPSTEAAADHYTEAELARMPLASTAVWDIPVLREGKPLHVVATSLDGLGGLEDAAGSASSHASDPADASPEELRHRDQLAFLRDLVTPARGSYVYDDAGGRGGLRQGEPFVVAAGLGADPGDSGAASSPVSAFLKERSLQDPEPGSEGAVEASDVQGGANASHATDSRLDTFDGDDARGGNLRLDYVLPSSQTPVTGAGVFWPEIGQKDSDLVGSRPGGSTRHRLVWADVE